MGVAFPGESPGYRAARDRLLEDEIELRRAMEAVANAPAPAYRPVGSFPRTTSFKVPGSTAPRPT